MKETQGEKVQKLEKARLRHEFYTPLIDKPTGKPYQQSQVLEISLTLPAQVQSKNINTKEIQEASKEFVKVFTQVEQHRKALLSGEVLSNQVIGDGDTSDPRREAYAMYYDTFTNSQNPFDNFLFQALELHFPKPEQVHLTRRLLPPQK